MDAWQAASGSFVVILAVILGFVGLGAWVVGSPSKKGRAELPHS